MSEFTTELKRLFENGDIEITDEQIEKMSVYYECLVETNKQYNITAVTQPKEAAFTHFFDSAFPAIYLPENAKVADVGSGGGFPIAPLKIMREDILATAIESSKKKCDFIKTASNLAKIRVDIINDRAETVAHTGRRGSFDVCVSRAVASLPVLLELCVPLVKKGGLFIAYKGNCQDEIKASENAMKLLALSLEKTIKLPAEGYEHNILLFRKHEKNEIQYPRNYSQIAKRPL